MFNVFIGEEKSDTMFLTAVVEIAFLLGSCMSFAHASKT